jgi:hypothetical protein
MPTRCQRRRVSRRRPPPVVALPGRQ